MKFNSPNIENLLIFCYGRYYEISIQGVWVSKRTKVLILSEYSFNTCRQVKTYNYYKLQTYLNYINICDSNAIPGVSATVGKYTGNTITHAALLSRVSIMESFDD